LLSSQVDLLQFTDPLTLKYLLSNDRLDVFCPELKSKLNQFLDESIRMKKRHGSGEAKFQENLRIPVNRFSGMKILSIMILVIMTLIIMTFSIMAFSKVTFSIVTL
jgi:hypothetical protein